MFCSRKVRSSLAVADPLSISERRYLSLSATVPENSDRFLAKLRIAEPLSTCVCSTTRESRISAVVTSKLASAVSMKELEVSMIWPRLGPASLNAAPDSATTVRRSACGTDCTRLSRLVRISVVETGICVSGVSISEPFFR